MNLRATIANSLWYFSNLPAWTAFCRALCNPAQTQEQVLTSILRRSASTAFGRQHGFDQIRNADDFRSRVPLRDYDEFEPWITRIRIGEKNVLTSDPVIRLATTAGTTSARKLIPYTRSLQAEFNRAIGPWIVDLFHTRPKLMTGTAYWSISPVARHEAEASEVPIGFEEDSEYLGGIRRHLVDAVLAVPASVRHAATMDDWREQTGRYLAKAADLRLISIWHPSFLDLILTHCGQSPTAMWPNLQVISCWGDAHAKLPINELREKCPDILIQPKGLIATEAMVSIPFAGHWPLAIRSHFFEFLDDTGVVRDAHQLEIGETYEVVVTTGGGLFRYRLNDRILVESRLRNTPSIRLVGKRVGVSDRFGEKLSEAFVSATLQKLAGDCSVSWRFAMLAPTGNAYTLFLEGEVPAGLSRRLDQALRDNPQYAYCRDLVQLTAPRIFRISQHGFETFVARQQSLGHRLGDIKAVALSTLDNWEQLFSGTSVD